MSFYGLTKKERLKLIEQPNKNIYSDIKKNVLTAIIDYFSDEDTYIRKSAYQAIGKIYNNNNNLQSKIISSLEKMITYKNPKIRQTTINAAGEIGIKEFGAVVSPLSFFGEEVGGGGYPFAKILCPNLSLLVSRYFLLCLFAPISMGTVSTISRP